MLRRDFLAGSGSLVLAGLAHPQLAPGQTAYVPAKIIDVHCHVFNADDLPIVDFIEKSVIRPFLHNQTAKPYAPVVDGYRGAAAARRQGRRQVSRRDQGRSPQGEDRRWHRFVVDLFSEWASSPGPPLPPRSPLSAKVLNSFLPRIALGFIRREMIPKVYSVPLDFRLGAALDNSDEAFTIDPNFDPYLGKQVYDAPQGQISRSIIWVVSFTRYRRELIADKVNDRRAVLMTPALVVRRAAGWSNSTRRQLKALG